VAPKVGGVTGSNGSKLAADGQLAGTPSVVFDAVALVLAKEAGAKLAHEAAAVDWVRDAFGHLKAIAFTPGAQALLDAAGIEADEAVIPLAQSMAFLEAAATRHFEREARVRTLA
jgi:catalase